ncbi:ABC transporter ATP-binding protein [Moorella naiadis]|uniref:ABC transporter ATP-binding protein n=1 Tax=Moorella naiadis (nom. illeg.) TaxID=3093670 RepID=UPI003D9CA6F9
METGNIHLTNKGASKNKISCSHLSKSFFGLNGTITEVLNNINLTVAENEFLVILGPGQCGKTTFLNIMAGLETPTSGEILLEGEPVVGPSPKRGMIFQRIALFPWKTVMENVAMGPKLQGVGKKEREEKAAYYIKLVGLEGFEKAYPHQLSGGMKQRVGIARAYTNDPEVLLMDEPFGHLDAQTRYQMEDEVLRIWEQAKRTVVFVTNNIEEAVYLGDRIILFSRCPATVKAEYSLNLPRPRQYTDPRFLELRQEIAAQTDLAL